MPVIAPLDLDQEVAAGDRPHQPNGLQGGLGPGVAEPPQGKAEPVHEVLANRVEVPGGLGEVRAPADLAFHRLHDLGMCMAHDHGPVAEMEVDVLVPVDVPDPRAPAPVDVDRMGSRVLPARGHPAGEGPLRDLAVGDRGSMLGLELLLLLGDQVIQPPQVQLDGLPHGHDARSLPPV